MLDQHYLVFLSDITIRLNVLKKNRYGEKWFFNNNILLKYVFSLLNLKRYCIRKKNTHMKTIDFKLKKVIYLKREINLHITLNWFLRLRRDRVIYFKIQPPGVHRVRIEGSGLSYVKGPSLPIPKKIGSSV